MAQEDYKMKSTETVTNNHALTAVEWLDERLQDKMYIQYGYHDGLRSIVIKLDEYMKLKQQAKQMEKEQIMDAYEQGAIDGRFEMFSDNTVHNALEYYIKTFQNDTIR